MDKDRDRSGSSGDVLVSRRMDGDSVLVSRRTDGDSVLVSRRTDGDSVLVSRMTLNDNKAGMEGLDRDKINKIILEASKGSRFYVNEQKKEQQVNQRIERMMQQKDSITEEELDRATTEVERLRAALERSRDLSRVMVHVDMDAFYAAVEMRDNPDLRDKPMAVGSTSMLRGTENALGAEFSSAYKMMSRLKSPIGSISMLSTSNYHARKFGVRAAMPGFIARKLCPSLVIVPTHFDKYRAVSSEIREIFSDYDPHFQPLSLDEAFLDLTDHLEERRAWPEARRTHCCRDPQGHQGEGQSSEGEGQSPPVQQTGELSPLLFDDSPTSSSAGSAPGFQLFDNNSPTRSSGGSGPGFQVFGTSAEEAVREMRFRIEQKTSLTASAGIAPNMLLAKVCSDLNKPNGQFLLPANANAVREFIDKLPVRKVSGIGKVSSQMLGALGITSCAHLGQKMALLSLLFSESAWHHFQRISMGLGATHLERDGGERKSMSTERTFRELSRAEDQVSLLRELCEDLSSDLKREGLKGKTVTLKLKNVQFEVRTRACSLPCAVGDAQEIFSVANQLLRTEMDSVKPLPLRLRLMGVRISSFVSSEDKAPQQRSIVGFLQQGRTDHHPPPPSSHLLLHPAPPPARLSSQDSSTQSPPPSACTHLPSTHLPSTQKMHPGQPPGGSGQQSGPGQRSFFQKAYAQRLRLQAEEDAASLSPPGTHCDKTTDAHSEKTTDTHTDKTTHTHCDESWDTAAAEEEPSGCSDPLRPAEGSMVCPVCSVGVATTDLGVFNAHIDLCLSSPVAMATALDTAGPPQGWEEEEEEPAWCVTMATEPSLGWTTDSGSRAERSEGVSSEPRSQTNSGAALGGGDSSRGVSETAAVMTSSRQQEAESQQRGPAPLTCPVCHVTQATADLDDLNAHLDLCLNQEVLQQLKGQRSLTSTAAGPTDMPKVKERVDPQPGTSNKLKGKRRHSPQSSPAKKKTKTLNPAPLNTIDRFLR